MGTLRRPHAASKEGDARVLSETPPARLGRLVRGGVKSNSAVENV